MKGGDLDYNCYWPDRGPGRIPSTSILCSYRFARTITASNRSAPALIRALLKEHRRTISSDTPVPKAMGLISASLRGNEGLP